jgi:tetratricopeptide (TPR) repeat protein
MRLKDPTAWLEDLTVYMDDEELTSTASELEKTLLTGTDRVRLGVWLSVVGIAAGGLGGVTVSPAIRASALAFVGFLTAAAILARGFHPLTRKMFGRGAAWLAGVTFFWAFLLGLFTVLGARRESTLWAYVLGVGMGAFIGMMNGSFAPSVVRREDTWVGVSFLSAPILAGLVTYAMRQAPGAASEPGWAMLGGAATAGLYTIGMSILLGRVWNDAHGLGQMAMVYLHNDNFAPKAIAYLDRGIATSPNDALLYNLRGIAWSKMGAPERAAADWRKAAELAPNDNQLHVNMAADHLRRGNIDEAIASLRNALAVDPNDARAHSNLGTALERRGDFDTAIEHYNRAIEIDGDYANAYSNRSYAYFRKGDASRALEDADRAIGLDHRLAMAYVNRGHALAALGHTHAAAVSYRGGLDSNADPSVRDEALRGLERIGASPSDDGDDNDDD